MGTEKSQKRARECLMVKRGDGATRPVGSSASSSSCQDFWIDHMNTKRKKMYGRARGRVGIKHFELFNP